jgi:DUF4097 and DUF4098 domain-containing protein YvlB
MRTELFRTDGPPWLRIELSSGDIDLHTVDGDETTVELTPLNDTGRQAIETAVVEQRGDEIVVEIEERRRLILFRDAKVRLKLTCPHGARVQLKTVAADVRARGRYGEVDLKSVSADMRVEDVEGDARLKTVSGDVRAGSVVGELTVQSVSGDAVVERVGGPAELRTVSGDVNVGDAEASVTIQTVSGDQGVTTVRQGAVQLKSVSGDVTLGIARGSRLWVDAKSVSGDTASDLDISDVPPAEGDDGPLVEVRATALSGDIKITRG